MNQTSPPIPLLPNELIVAAIHSGERQKVHVLTNQGRCLRVCIFGESYFIEALTYKQPEQHKDRTNEAMVRFLADFEPSPKLKGLPFSELYDLYTTFCAQEGTEALPRNTVSWAIRLTFPKFRTTSVKGQRFCNLNLKPQTYENSSS